MSRTYLSFSGEINQAAIDTLLGLCAQQANQVEEIYLLLSTLGGQVTNGITAYNVLRGLPVKLITHNVGNVNSIGNVLFLAGRERYACPTSSFMFHGVGINLPQGARLEEKELQEKLDGILNDQNLIGQVIQKETLITGEEVKSLFHAGATKDVHYAKEKGLIQDIREVHIPKGSNMIQIAVR